MQQLSQNYLIPKNGIIPHLLTDPEKNIFCMTYAGHLGTSMVPIYLQGSVQNLTN